MTIIKRVTISTKGGMFMLATIVNAEKGYLAQFDRLFNHPIEKVWAVLTENDKLKIWMSHLEIVDLKKDGLIKFHHNDGSDRYEEMKITDFVDSAVLEFEWGADIVRFELQTLGDGCLFILKEFISELTDHTPKDLAGWHVCLNMFEAVLENKTLGHPENEWEKWFEEYKELMNEI